MKKATDKLKNTIVKNVDTFLKTNHHVKGAEMAIIDIQEAKEMKRCFRLIGGREGVSKRALEICKRVAESGSYRQAVFAIGRMARLHQVCKADSYWDEKSSYGKDLEYYAVLQASEREGDFTNAPDAFGDEKR